MNKNEAKKIADLARLEIDDAELDKIASEMSSILEYVDKIKSVDVAGEESRVENAGVRNVMSNDDNPNKSGENTDVLIKEVPESQDNLVKVKKIL